MEFLPLSFLAGLLTILAPCVLPLLPVIIGGSASKDEGADENTRNLQPLIVTASLAVSLVIFTIALRATTTFIGIDPQVWQTISGGILILVGILFIFPHLWETVSQKFNLNTNSNKLLGKSITSESKWKPVLIGASLGPVFTSCSPTYAVVLAKVFPESFFVGTLNIIVYVLGLSIVMLAIGYGGQKITDKIAWMSNPDGAFKRVMGVIFLSLGAAIIFGLDKKFETWLLEQGAYDFINDFEFDLIDKIEE